MTLFQIIQKRRAYRSLVPVEITEEIITTLAGSAQLSPSCFNNQPWRYVFVYKKRSLDELYRALSKGNDWARKSSLIIAVFSKPEYDCQIKGRNYYLFDTGMATAFIILRATELGLVAHPIAGFDQDIVREILCIPEEMTVITLLVVGKKSKTISPILSEKQVNTEKKRPQRLGITEFVFRNRYDG
jgi:nitroreductase